MTKRTHNNILVIRYMNGAIQIVKPKINGPKEERFDGDWKALAEHIAGQHPHKFEIR